MPKPADFKATFKTLRALLKGVSPSLLKRMQGKSCFNFTAIAPAHVKELEALTKKASTASSRSSSR